MSAKPANPKMIDFYLCGTTGSATAVSTYGVTGTGISVPTGIKIGYWDYSAQSLNTTTVIGTVSGTFNTYPVGCIKVGVAEAVVATAKAYYNENTSTWPITAAAINSYNTTGGPKLPNGVSAILVNPTSGNGTTQVKFECGTAVAATLPCNNTGGRITYWDYTLSNTASITYGTATNFAVPLS